MRRNRFPLAVAIAATTVCFSGCSVFEDEDDDRQPVTDMSMYAGVPSGAMRVAQGHDTVRYRATQAGRVWVGNDNRRVVITETRVQAGDEIAVDAAGDRVTVNGQVVYGQNLEKNHQHSIFFVPDGAN